MKKPKKGKPRPGRPRSGRKKSRNRRRSLRQHILFARRWCRRLGLAPQDVYEQLDVDPDERGEWTVHGDTADQDELVVDRKVRGALLSIINDTGAL